MSGLCGKPVAAVFASLVVTACSKPVPPECAGPPLKTAEQFEEAYQKGYEVNPYHKCIDKASFEAVNRQLERGKEARRAARPAFPEGEAAK